MSLTPEKRKLTQTEELILHLEHQLHTLDTNLQQKFPQKIAQNLAHYAHEDNPTLLQQLQDMEIEETKLQLHYIDAFQKMASTKREWIQRIMNLLTLECYEGHTHSRRNSMIHPETSTPPPNRSPSLSSRIHSNSAPNSPRKTGSAYNKLIRDSAILNRNHGYNHEELKGWGTWELSVTEVTIYRNAWLGAGQYGEVHRGICRGKEVAIKTLRNIDFNENVVHEFKRECAIMRSLSHPSILLFMGACLVPGHYYLVTELCPLGSLHDYIHPDEEDSKGKLDLKRKIDIAKQIAEGVNWLHKQKPPLLHLDLKPPNLLVTENWTIKIADFGLSRLQSAQKTKEPLSVTGTPFYMPPEMFALEPSVTLKCDVYAYGIILCEMISERYPYNRQYKQFLALQNAVLKGERPEIDPNTPQVLEELIALCWHPDLNQRPSFSEILKSGVHQKAVCEAVAGQLNQGITKMWSNFGQNDKVEWSKFKSEFAIFMKTEESDRRLMAIYALLDVDQNGGHVTWDKLHIFVQMFGILLPCDGDMSTLEQAWKLLKKDWFWGELDRNQAQEELQEKERILHKCIGLRTVDDLTQTIKLERKRLKLKTPISGRPAKFVSLFVKDWEMPEGRYTEGDFPPAAGDSMPWGSEGFV